MFKVGDRVICIDNNPLDGNWYSLDKSHCLTLYKEYTVILKNNTTISIMNDQNLQQPFANKRFISLLEYRKLKIEKICSKLEIE